MARLADYSNDEGVSWPAIETIRRQIGARSESTVKSAIAELAKEGWLTKEERKVGGRNVSNIYRLNVEKLEAAAAAAREAYKPKRKISPAKNDPLTVDQSNIAPSMVGPSNFDGSTVDKKLPIRGTMIDPDQSVLKPDPSDEDLLCPDVSLPDKKQSSPVERFLEKHPDAHTWTCRSDSGVPVRMSPVRSGFGDGLLRCMNRPPVMMVRYHAPENLTGRPGRMMCA